MKGDISVNLDQKYLILCSKILLNVLFNMSLAMATYWVPDLPILKALLATFAIPFLYMYLLTALHIYMVQQA